MTNRTARTAFTNADEEVYLNELSKVEGGWEGYVIGSKGYAVLVFVPAN